MAAAWSIEVFHEEVSSPLPDKTELFVSALRQGSTSPIRMLQSVAEFYSLPSVSTELTAEDILTPSDRNNDEIMRLL